MGINIFDGLEGLGIKGLSADKLFEDTSSTKEVKRPTLNVKKEPEVTPTERELAMLFDKTYTCPVCDKVIKSRTVRTGKARLLGMDLDLKQNYEYIEPIKYDVIACHGCGFTAVSRYFVPMIPSQKKSILEKITPTYIHKSEPEGIIPFDFAVERYKMALANAVVRNAKPSERAFICLKAGWLCRSWKQSLIEEGCLDDEKLSMTEELEKEFLKYAYDGFIMAVQSERFPICGMDEYTINYLIAAMAYNLEKYDVSAKMIAKIITSVTAPSRMKDKARDLKGLVLEAMRNNQ